jgi:hypothetical protein
VSHLEVHSGDLLDRGVAPAAVVTVLDPCCDIADNFAIAPVADEDGNLDEQTSGSFSSSPKPSRICRSSWSESTHSKGRHSADIVDSALDTVVTNI